MKNLLKKSKLVLIVLLIVFTYSCSSEDGTDGTNGVDGTDGTDGSQGEQGEPGTANVMYSEWLPQVFNFADEANYKGMLVDDDNVNNAFLDNGGIVLGFFRFQDNVPYQLPYLNHSNNNTRTLVPVHFAETGQVRFYIESTDETALTDSEVNGSSISNPEYKYVLIPGGTPLTASRSTPIKWEKLSYKEVCDYLGIEY